MSDKILTERGTTWGELRQRPAPWKARCHRCARLIGTFDDRDAMSDAILAHVARCTRLRAWARVFVDALRAARAESRKQRLTWDDVKEEGKNGK